MTRICKFWLQGHCRYGDACRFDHTSSASAASDRTSNRFAPLNSENSGIVPRGQYTLGSRFHYQKEPTLGAKSSRMSSNFSPETKAHSHRLYGLDRDAIRADLSNDQPNWVLSSYGPGKNAPAQLFGGLPREQSFEEIRLRYYHLAAQGQSQQAIDETKSLVATAMEQMRIALQDVNGAIDFICSSEEKHPNRIDVCNAGSQSRLNSSFEAPGNRITPTSKVQPSLGFSQRTGVLPAQDAAHPEGLTFGRPSLPSSNPFGRTSMVAGPYDTSFSGRQGSVAGFIAPSATSLNTNPFSRARSNADLQSPSRKLASDRSESFGVTAVTQVLNRENRGPLSSDPASSKFDQGSHRAEHHVDGSLSVRDAMFRNEKSDVGNIAAWGSRTVSYPDNDNEPCIRRSDGQWERIWFLEGPPVRNMTQEIPLESYDEDITQRYKYLQENGHFKNSVVPQYPPKWEWTTWDF